MSPSLATTLAGRELETPIYNASGPYCTSEEELRNLAESMSPIVLTKSMTFEPSEGNEMPKYWTDGKTTINSNGLQNLGYHEYLRILKELRDQYPKKLFIPSIASKGFDKTMEIIHGFKEAGFTNIELNVSCPNIPGSPQILAYKFEELGSLIDTLGMIYADISIGLKLPIYRPDEIDIIDNIILDSCIKYIVTINSVPYCTDINLKSMKTVIHPNKGLGGMGGPALLPIGLGQVRMHYANLQGKIDIVGVGGATTGEDAIKYMACGANAVQIGSSLSVDGLDKFLVVNSEVATFMRSNDIDSLERLIGTSQVLEVD